MQVPYSFGLTTQPLKPFVDNEKNAERLEELLSLQDSDLILRIGKHYIQNFVLSPIELEDEYWMISCFPGDVNIPVRVNIYWHEVMNISEAADYTEDQEKWEIVIFTHEDFIEEDTVKELKGKIEGLEFDREYRYSKGLDAQLAAILPLEAYFTFVSDERVYESIRQYNHQLASRGRKVHKGHNYELARMLLKA